MDNLPATLPYHEKGDYPWFLWSPLEDPSGRELDPGLRIALVNVQGMELRLEA